MTNINTVDCIYNLLEEFWMADIMVYGGTIHNGGTALEMRETGFCDIEHGEDVHVEGIL